MTSTSGCVAGSALYFDVNCDFGATDIGDGGICVLKVLSLLSLSSRDMVSFWVVVALLRGCLS